MLAFAASTHTRHLSHETFILMFALIGSDVIFAFPCQHRWMSHRTKAVTVSQEGRLNYHFQGCALHQRGTHIYRQDSHNYPWCKKNYIKEKTSLKFTSYMDEEWSKNPQKEISIWLLGRLTCKAGWENYDLCACKLDTGMVACSTQWGVLPSLSHSPALNLASTHPRECISLVKPSLISRQKVFSKVFFFPLRHSVVCIFVDLSFISLALKCSSRITDVPKYF